ncbi:ABC transporter ATP-binding protein [Pseudovibrio brasiliensis]|uniref:Sn-glycerol-3-phosphate ABC transporter ATP-binding protein UgpC n=1 Tax=Pseudovibrio brasiliensis TaxID=1898042 RepID=A0ABX8AUF2_9HYPH|nr:sn-glycerol-3-phosphate ABC transporter ATP-binding protein UgpC [Pseudovibrio brasiliensis]QUS58350.1 sn-glycerol-3-phosphate ABC transporter ATP-binding protein UgpC [Pseudovibrio brasiliensis]
MSSLSLKNIKKSYGQHEVIHGVDLEVEKGEFIVFVGPSGCGKSTMLRMISGLEEVTSGQISIADKDVTRAHPSKREIAMVFQSYALFPHMSVADNISFGLRLGKTPKDEVKRRVNEVADTLQITHLLERFPRQLSGGQRQRVAIGRAIIRNPQVFLFDEPLSNLDAALRVQMRLEIARLHKRLGATIIYVTHDQTEAMTLADRIVVFNHGVIEQVGRPIDLYERPANKFVAGFLGAPSMNFIGATAQQGAIQLDGFNITDAQKAEANGAITLGIRPEHMRISDTDACDFSAKVELVEELGSESLAYLQTSFSSDPLTMRVDHSITVREGDMLPVSVNREFLHVFEENGASL